MLKHFYFKQFIWLEICGLNVRTVPFQAIRLILSLLFEYKTVLFQAIQFSISTQFCSVSPIDMTLAVASILGLSGPQSYGNGGELRIPQGSSINEASLSDCFKFRRRIGWSFAPPAGWTR